MQHKTKLVIPLIEIKNTGNNFSSVYEFHISRDVRKKYDFDEILFSFDGNVIFANFHAARMFTQKLNEKRDSRESVRVGQVNAMGLLDEIYHYVLRSYEEKVNPAVFTRAAEFLVNKISSDKIRKTLVKFVELFPPMDVHKGKIHAEEYVDQKTGDKANREIILEELILLHFANYNPANLALNELFNDDQLRENTNYPEILLYLEQFFQGEKKYGPEEQFIFDLLRAPILSNPNSIEDQLKFIINRWAIILDPKYLDKLLSGMDLIKEDKRLGAFGGGGAPTVVPRYKSAMEDTDYLSLGKSGYKYGADAHLAYLEAEKFTPDIHWMPQVVLLAKNIYVWLDQLSKKYNRTINTLNLIPDEELDLLATRNFTGLWLIGIWERSRASQKIKQLTGNPEAVPSAYSVYDYVIAFDLGGEEAFQNLNERCQKRGIRLASDMVPNHMGIYSKWVIEHPDYFIQMPHSPFPNYRFTGPDLSEDSSVQLRIEDGYWSKSDAAVVFQRIDNNSGEVRYIYHGNDGTNMPWNDTAQLDMLKSEVREAVIQTIFHVARKTSIIRFDAAMTLAKKHFHRLWYPQPGTGGDIPSRSDHALRQEDFDRLFPKEFWREVVDRINQEMPDTLLLAEAFWLMEGYFVRTLGMHRVYNSAFMHMMMKEENEKYRRLISNTLEFNPEILKRYVNFMSNPDEETAIKQFGTDDKYFGVAVLLVTLPGLPMFGHGQIEGYSEKYGMEYKRAYYNEMQNDYLVERHKKEIFPLMRKRYMFSQVNDFWFFDFKMNDQVNENVFAYTNKFNDERAIVVYNNKFEEVTGRIHHSTGKITSSENSQEKSFGFKSLSQALNINPSENHYYIYRDHISSLEYIRSGRDIADNGLYIELKPFKYHVFLDFKEVYDTNGEFANLTDHLQGRGVESILQTLISLRLHNLHDAYLNLFDSKAMKILTGLYVEERIPEKIDENLRFVNNRYYYLLNEIKNKVTNPESIDPLLNRFKNGITALKGLNEILTNEDFLLESEIITEDFKRSVLLSKESNYPRNLLIYLIWLSLNNIGEIKAADKDKSVTLELIDELHLFKPVSQVLQRLGRSENDVNQVIRLIRLLIKYNPYNTEPEEKFVGKTKKIQPKETKSGKRLLKAAEISFIEKLLADKEVKEFIGVNYYEKEWYYSKELLDELIQWMVTIRIMNYICRLDGELVLSVDLMNWLKDTYNLSKYLKDISVHSEYKLTNLNENILAGQEA